MSVAECTRRDVKELVVDGLKVTISLGVADKKKASARAGCLA